eukprot:5581262-Prymnesium_polylepis.1
MSSMDAASMDKFREPCTTRTERDGRTFGSADRGHGAFRRIGTAPRLEARDTHVFFVKSILRFRGTCTRQTSTAPSRPTARLSASASH